MIERQGNIRHSRNTIPVEPKSLSGGKRANRIERIEVTCLLISLVVELHLLVNRPRILEVMYFKTFCRTHYSR